MSALTDEGRRLAALRGPGRHERVLDLVLDCSANVLGMGAGTIDPDVGFFDLGLDSVTSLRLKAAVEDAVGVQLPDTVTFELPTPEQFAAYVANLLDAPAEPPNPGAIPSGPDTDDEFTRLLSELDTAVSDARTLMTRG